MADVFTWRVYSQQPRVEYTYAERSARFGDGYEQTAPEGLNNESQTWQLELWGHGTTDDLDAALLFLRSSRRQGKRFLWTPPGDVQGLYQCTELSKVDELEGFIRLTCKFEQKFHP